MKCGSDVSGEQGTAATAMMPAAPERDVNEAVLEMLRQATIGDYEILKELGRGGMATVYLAHDIALDRKVAIKVMSPALLLMGEGMTERFKREARTAASLSHPNIIPIYTVKGSGKSLYFIMKFIAGRSLEAIIKDIGPMPIPMVKAILQQVGSALGYAHRHGIVHRDVKPANIMIDEEGWSVVTDFGIAKVAENRGLTMTGIAVGTPSYMSPEQCAAKDITGKSDQYSLGVVAYEMLTGKQPFEGDSAMAIMFAHFHEQPKALTDSRGDCPPDLATTVMRMLEKAPDRRWPSMEEMVSALNAQPLAHEDPIRLRLIELAKKGSSGDLLRQLTPPPTSPVPPAHKTRPMAEQATTPIPAQRVLSVAIVPARSDLHVGDTMQLTATPRSSGGTAAAGKIEWASSDPAIAGVTATGLVTALAPGNASITARCEAVSGTAQVSVTPVPVHAVLVEPAESDLPAGDELQFRVTLRDAHGAALTDRTVRWSAAPASTATIGANGLATAVREGKAEITAECEGIKGTARLTIAPAAIARVTVAPVEASVVAGLTVTLEATALDKRSNKVPIKGAAWTSSKPDIATVSERGVVTGIAEGAAAITCEVAGQKATAQVKVTAAPVSQVVIAALKPVVVGDRVALEAETRDAKGKALTGRAIKWTSSSPGVATVTADGHLTGMAAGSAKITAECEGKSATATVTVQPVPVAAVTIEGGSEPLTVGGTAALKAIAKDARGAVLVGREASWVSSAPKVLPVNAQGVVTARSAGEATISATIEGKKAERRLTVTAAAPVAAAAAAVAATEVMEPPAPAAKTDKTEVIEPRRETRPVEKPAPAPSGGRGKLIGAVVGLAVVAVGAFLALHRSPSPAPAPHPGPTPPPVQVASVAILTEAGPLSVGHTRQTAVVVKDAAGNELPGRGVVWTSSDSTVAAVSPLGAITGRKSGTVTITAASEGHSGTVQLTVQPAGGEQPAAVAAIEVSGGGKSLDVGQTTQLTAVAKDAKGNVLTDRRVAWSQTDPDVATVNSTGLVTARGPGTTSIYANSENQRAEAKITVNQPPPPKPAPAPPPAPAPVTVASVELHAPSSTVVAGQSIQLSARALDSKKRAIDGSTITWKSSNERVARVGPDGTVNALEKGTVTITASAEKQSASVELSVEPATVPVGSVAINAPERSLKVGETASWSAVPRDPKGKELQGRTIAWTSSAQQVATVNDNGQITAVGPGTAMITASVEGKTVSEKLTVAAAPAPAPAPAPTTPAVPAAPAPSAAGNALLPSRAAVAGGFSCGITQAGGAVCWGGLHPQPTAIQGTAGVTQVAVGGGHACALQSGGQVVCWGENRAGQLGNGTTKDSPVAVPVAGNLSFTFISAGGGHTCGISGGKGYCWGKGHEGQIGDGGTSDRDKPTPVHSGEQLVSIAAGGSHSCAVTTSGKALCWGDGFSGELGFGGTESESDPTEVSSDQKWSRIAAGQEFTCALNAAGKAFCWGSNKFGQLGDGSTDDANKPRPVSASQTFSEIAVGNNHACALTSSGQVFCWGFNRAGQVGDGSTANRAKPVPVSGGPYLSISAGAGHTCAMAAGGQPFCWGRDDRGQVGDGSTGPSRSSPTAVRAN